MHFFFFFKIAFLEKNIENSEKKLAKLQNVQNKNNKKKFFFFFLFYFCFKDFDILKNENSYL